MGGKAAGKDWGEGRREQAGNGDLHLVRREPRETVTGEGRLSEGSKGRDRLYA